MGYHIRRLRALFGKKFVTAAASIVILGGHLAGVWLFCLGAYSNTRLCSVVGIGTAVSRPRASGKGVGSRPQLLLYHQQGAGPRVQAVLQTDRDAAPRPFFYFFWLLHGLSCSSTPDRTKLCFATFIDLRPAWTSPLGGVSQRLGSRRGADQRQGGAKQATQLCFRWGRRREESPWRHFF